MLHFLHITKTGGCARRYALTREMILGNVLFAHQEQRLLMLTGTPVVYLREPVARFVSQWDSFGHTIRRNGPAFDYQDINAFAADMGYALKHASPRSRLMWQPQSWWVNADRDDAIFLKLEEMDTDFPLLLEAHGLHGTLPSMDVRAAHADSGVEHPLTDATLAIVQERYAKDFELYAHIPPYP